jgi:hypothetical protein
MIRSWLASCAAAVWARSGWEVRTSAQIAISAGPWRTRQDALVHLVLDHQQATASRSNRRPGRAKATAYTLTTYTYRSTGHYRPARSGAG